MSSQLLDRQHSETGVMVNNTRGLRNFMGLTKCRCWFRGWTDRL